MRHVIWGVGCFVLFRWAVESGDIRWTHEVDGAETDDCIDGVVFFRVLDYYNGSFELAGRPRPMNPDHACQG